MNVRIRKVATCLYQACGASLFGGVVALLTGFGHLGLALLGLSLLSLVSGFAVGLLAGRPSPEVDAR